MAKRHKMIIAGRLVSEIAYSVAHPRDPEHVRQAKTKMSTKARQKQNLKAACRALELLLATNFTGRAGAGIVQRAQRVRGICVPEVSAARTCAAALSASPAKIK